MIDVAAGDGGGGDVLAYKESERLQLSLRSL